MKVTLFNLKFFFETYINRNCPDLDFCEINEFIDLVRAGKIYYMGEKLTTNIKKIF